MEKIKAIISNFEKNLTENIEIDLLNKFEGNLKTLNLLINQISEKKKETAGILAGKDMGFNFEEYFDGISNELNGITVKFANVSDLTKKLETDEALKQFLMLKLDEIFENISEAATKQFNLSTFEIFNEILNNLKINMEKNLVNRIEKEMFSIKTGFGEFQKIYGVVGNQFSSIQQSVTSIQEKYINQLESFRLESEIIGKIFPKIDGLTKNLNQDYNRIQEEIGKKLSNIQQTSLQLLNILKNELNIYEKGVEHISKESKMSLEESERLKRENIKMKAELENISKELEKVTVNFEHLSKEKDRKIERREALALVMTLLVEVFGAQPHSKLLYLLHGKRVDMDRISLTKASGIAGAMVRKALADLNSAKLIEYNVESGRVKLLKHIY